jgi:hypothetical protein
VPSSKPRGKASVKLFQKKGSPHSDGQARCRGEAPAA